MEEIVTTEIQETSQPAGCVNCHNPVIEEGYPTPLCKDCRQQFVKFPIPLWIKIFGGAITAIVLFALFSLPKSLGLGIHFERGKKAEKAKNYLTAQREYEKIAAAEPEYTDAMARLLIASFHNQDITTFSKTFVAIENKKVEDEELYSEVGDIMDKVGDYFPGDSLRALSERYDNKLDSIPDAVYLAYTNKYPNDVFAKEMFITKIFESSKYTVADTMAGNLLADNPDYVPALGMKASIKRQLNQFDSSISYCDRILQLNHESTYGYSSKARTLLKQKKDKEGLLLAQKVQKLDDKDSYNMATLVIAYHLNNKTKERDELLHKAAGDSTLMQDMSYAKDVVSGKEKFRD